MTPGGGFGALDTMNKTLKNNRKLLSKIKVFDRIKNYNSALKNKRLRNTKTATPDQLSSIRTRAIANNRRQTIRKIIKITIGILIVMVAMYLMTIGLTVLLDSK